MKFIRIKDVHFEVMDHGNKNEKLKYALLGITYAISVVLLTVLLTYLTYSLRMYVTDFSNVIYYDFSWTRISFGPWFIFSMIVLALPLEILQFKLFPKKITKKDQKWHFRNTYIAMIISSIVTVPLVFLLFDFYRIVTPNEIIKNDFLSYSEDHYPFDEVSSVEIDGYLKEITFHLDVIINTKNEDSFELFNSGSLPNDQEIEVIRILNEKNLPIKILRLPSEEDFNHIASLSKKPNGKEFDGAKASKEARHIFNKVNRTINP